MTPRRHRVAGLHQRLPRLAARHGRPAGVEGRRSCSTPPASSFLPAINEELGATAVLGTQRVESDPERTADGVFAMWYGKGPGVDRAGDALKHGNAYGSSPHGGVLVVAGDDHGCVSSSMPHQSDAAMQSWHMPVLAPANVAEYLEFGLYGWALSRFSGNWVGFTALSEVVESGSTVDLDETNARVAAWKNGAEVAAATGFVASGRRPALPLARSAVAEDRGSACTPSSMRCARSRRSIRSTATSSQRRARRSASSPAARRTSTCSRCSAASTSRSPRSPTPAFASTRSASPIRSSRRASTRSPTALDEILVVEEKAGLVEQQLRDLFYNRAGAADGRRQARRGGPAARHRARRAAAVAPDRDRRALARRRASAQLDRRHLVRDFTVPELLSNVSDAVKRVPYFCAGCPHNTSTKVPEGSRAQAGIGCHFMASWMDRDTEGLIQMGGEGVDWVSHAMFTKVPHVFQNLGDGTYYHSGYLAIRQAIAAEDQRHLQDPVQRRRRDDRRPAGRRHHLASTRSRARSRPRARPRCVVLSDDIAKYDAIHDRSSRPAPSSTTAPSSTRCSGACARCQGVTDPDLRADLRRREAPAQEEGRAGRSGAAPLHQRARSAKAAATARCSRTASPSLPLETELGRKRKIDQSSCNKDYSCAKGFCPSFVGVVGGRLKKRPARSPARRGALRALVDEAAAARARTTGPARTTCSSPASAAPASSPSAR